MRALIVVENSWIPIDRRVWYEATTLRDAGWQVSVICPAASGAHARSKTPGNLMSCEAEDLQGVMVYRFPLVFAEHGIVNYIKEYSTAFFSIARLTWRIWLEEGFDILHICNPPDIFFALGFFYRTLGAKFVFDHHDLFTENIAWRFKGPIGKLLYLLARVSEFLTFRMANVVIATNQSYRNIAKKRGLLPDHKVIIVRNGPRINEFTPTKPDFHLKRGYKHMVCYVGVMAEEDGVVELTDVISHVILDLKRQDILFTMIGDGAVREKVLGKITSLGLLDYVDMPGMIRDDLILRKYMSTADIFVSPEPLTPMNQNSTFLKIGEYMAIGKPVIAYDLPETRFTAQDAAIYIPSGDTAGFSKAILHLIDNPHISAEMGQRGRQRILTNLGWEYQAHNLFLAYSVALGQNIS